MKNLLQHKWILLIFAIFSFFTFYNLNWGAPFYFHPDERNIASAVTRLDISQKELNPKFFAYGGFPIYSIYFTSLINNFLQNPFIFSEYKTNFDEAIIISRLYSSLLTIATVFLIFTITKKYISRKASILALFLGITSVGYLQYSHFGTFEIWLSFFYLLLFYISYIYYKNKNFNYVIYLGLIFGASVAIKISSIVLIIIPLSVILLNTINHSIKRKILYLIKNVSIFLYFSLAFYIISNPYVFLDFKSFSASIGYESSVALGTLQVFYSETFIGTLPFFFQLFNVYPFILNPVITLLLLFATSFSIIYSLKKKNVFVFLLLLSFLSIFLSQIFLYVKWTRYFIPSISFVYILISFFLIYIKKYIDRNLWIFIITITIFFSFLFSFSFIKTVRLTPDTRIQAAEFASEKIEHDSLIISEVYDLGIVPFNQYLNKITLFNFYDLDQSEIKISELKDLTEKSEYIIIPSTRIMKTRLENNKHFPQGHSFYSDLINNNTTFKKIYSTPCDFFCSLLYFRNSIYELEETAYIFDRPTIYIFKKEL